MRIAIEANIGAGKSTVIAALRDAFPDVPMYTEPVDAWKDVLEAFYENKNRWAFALQMLILKEYLRPKYTDVASYVSERCIYSCRYVFGQTLYGDGSMTEKEWKLFKEYCDVFETVSTPDAIIYIRTDPAICLERVVERNRPAEEGMTLEYLQKLNFQYENIVKYFPGTVHVVDGDRASDAVYKDVENIIRECYYYGREVRSADKEKADEM